MTKKEIVAQIQTLANEYTGTPYLDFSHYIHKNKPDLLKKLDTAQKMIECWNQYKVLEASRTTEEWDKVTLFPYTCDATLITAKVQLNELWRQANFYWFLV